MKNISVIFYGMIKLLTLSTYLCWSSGHYAYNPSNYIQQHWDAVFEMYQQNLWTKN